MKINGVIIKSLGAVALYTSLSSLGFASCSLAPMSDGSASITTTATVVTPLNAIMSIPEHVPVGTIIYRGVFDSANKVFVKCTTSSQYYSQMFITSGSASIGNVEDYTSAFVAGSLVYPTGLTGVGMVFSNFGASHANNKYVASSICSSASGCKFTLGNSVNIYFIKTGTVFPGVINGTSLPVFEQRYGQMNRMVTARKASFTGNITITTPTCTTPDVAVDMGNWNINQFSGVGSGTDWVDVSLMMQNCTPFYGYGAGHVHSSDGSLSYTDSSRSNIFSLTLTPLFGVTGDGSDGIMNISGGSGAADGVGIQLGFATTGSPSSNLVNYTQPTNWALNNSGASAFRMPLAARYIQTKETITSGRADGKLTFTLSYK